MDYLECALFRSKGVKHGGVSFNHLNEILSLQKDASNMKIDPGNFALFSV